MIPLTPKFSHIGLDVGSAAIKAVQFTRSAKGLHILAAACIERTTRKPTLPADEAVALRGILSRQGFRGRAIVLGGPTGRMISSVMELPPRSSGAPLDQIARVELARANDCAPDSIELSWWDLPAGQRAQEGTHVFALGLRHTDAEEALIGLEVAGFEVRALDSGVLGLARACASVGLGGDAHVTGVLDIGWSAATLAVLLGQTLVYQRFLPEMGLARLHARLISDLAIDAEAAEFVLRRVGVLNDLPEDQRDWELLDDARSIVADHAEAIGSELKASLSYAMRRYGARGSMGVAASGGGACVPGMLARIQEAAEESVRALRTSDFASAPADPLLTALATDPRLVCAAGLAIDPARVPTPEPATP